MISLVLLCKRGAENEHKSGIAKKADEVLKPKSASVRMPIIQSKGVRPPFFYKVVHFYLIFLEIGVFTTNEICQDLYMILRRNLCILSLFIESLVSVPCWESTFHSLQTKVTVSLVSQRFT